jgi:hypothetical protein
MGRYEAIPNKQRGQEIRPVQFGIASYLAMTFFYYLFYENKILLFEVSDFELAMHGVCNSICI